VDPKVLADERDVELFLAALKKTRSIANYPGFARMLKREMQPGPEVQTDEQLIDYIRNEVVTTYHPTGTCKVCVCAYQREVLINISDD
jgi:choline dehydrogenase-like flavoprotein